MAQGKKISELNEVSSVTDNDEFIFVDKEGSGANSGVGGKTAKIKFSDLKSAIGAGETGAKGASGDKGMKGEPGPRGLDGAGTQYWTQSPTDGDAVYYDAGNVGIGTDAPVGKLHIESSDNGTALGPDVILMRESTNPVAGGLLGSLRFQGRTHSGNGAIKVEYADIKAEIVDPAGGGKLVFRTRQENSGTHHTMVLDNNGNVGIGTTAPTHKLHIEGGVRIQPSASKPGFVFGSFNTDTPDGTYLQFGWAGGDNLSGQTASKITLQSVERFGTNQGGYRDLILNEKGGNVGIGTDSISKKLTVNGGVHVLGANKIHFSNTPDQVYINASTSNTMSLYTDNQRRMLIDADGNIGIGTDSPNAKLDIVIDGNKYSKLTGTFSIDLTTNNGNATLVGVNSLLASEIRPNLEVYAPNNDGVMTFVGQASSTDDDLSCFLLLQTDTKQFPAFDNVELYVSDKVVAVTSESADYDCFNIRSNKQVEIGGYIESHGLKMSRPGESTGLAQNTLHNAEYITSVSYNGDAIGIRDYVYSELGQHERTHSDIRGRLSVGTTNKSRSILRVKHHGTILVDNAEIVITKDSNVVTAINGTATFLTDFAPGDKFTIGTISSSDQGFVWSGIVESVTDDNTFIASTNAPVTITREDNNQRHRRIYKFSDTYDRSIVRFDKFDNSNAFSVHSDGNVGINTSLPWAPLTVNKSIGENEHASNSQISIALEPDIGFGCGIRFHTTGNPSVYAPGTVFNYGNKVNHNGDLWEAISSNMTDVEPGTDETKWRLLTEEVASGENYYHNVYNGNAIKWNYYEGGNYEQKMALSNKGGLSVQDGATIRRSFADDPSAASGSAILNVVDTTIADAHKSEFMVLGNGNIHQGGPQHVFNGNGPSTNNTASSVMWSQKLPIPATTTAGTGGYTHYTFNIGNYVYGKFTIMAARTNVNANYVFAEYIVSNNSGTLHSTALNEKLIGGNVEIKVTALNNDQTGLSSSQCQFKIAMNQTQSPGSITVFWHGSSNLASTDHDDSHTNW